MELSIAVNIGGDKWRQEFQIALEKVTPHEEFQSKPLRNDIAIMQTSIKILFYGTKSSSCMHIKCCPLLDNIQPARLPLYFQKPPSLDDRRGYTVGFNTNNGMGFVKFARFLTKLDFYSTVEPSERLMHAIMEIISNNYCVTLEGFNKDEHFCARSIEETFLTPNDVGGAFTFHSKFSKIPTVIGILSALPLEPSFNSRFGLYTRVSVFVKWIQEKTNIY